MTVVPMFARCTHYLVFRARGLSHDLSSIRVGERNDQ